MQIEIYNPTQGEQIQPVKWNYEQLKAQIEQGLQKYKGVIYTEETIAVAKQNRADLNRLSKAISDERIAMKKRYLAPYEEFERQAKELTALIDAQSEEINQQVKEFEQAEKTAKQAEIKAIYKELLGDLTDLIPYERIHDEKWLNKGTKLEKVREVIMEVLQNTKASFEAINNMGLDEALTNRVKAAYLKRFNLSDALIEKDRIQEENRRLAEYEARKQAETRQEAEKRPADARKEESGTTEPLQLENAPEAQTEAPELVQIDFRVWATREQLSNLKRFLIENQIKYGRVQD